MEEIYSEKEPASQIGFALNFNIGLLNIQSVINITRSSIQALPQKILLTPKNTGSISVAGR
jgi:hypothetical protein